MDWPQRVFTQSALSMNLRYISSSSAMISDAPYHNVPQVWGAINPKSFQFEEQQSTSSTASNYWVNPQFEKLPPSVPQGRRGRKACIAASNILDKSSQLLRKTSVSKFPSLSFARSTAQPLHHKRAHVTNTLECAVGAKQSLHVHEVMHHRAMYPDLSADDSSADPGFRGFSSRHPGEGLWSQAQSVADMYGNYGGGDLRPKRVN
ncbi:hypothetical protein DPEC_G00114370 [Dallia pectoralis]|uniref:Uncharacterized protein n=1 Tax=Dallia pectoralis TaxID=75939 RepID=A0ACC2GUJ5_DALPE|nr:hypothetical protein DPEC_G00114370 [Dallia pectoralis]